MVANLRNPGSRRACENAIRYFMTFTGIASAEEFRAVTRAHVIAWPDDIARRKIGLPSRPLIGAKARRRRWIRGHDRRVSRRAAAPGQPRRMTANLTIKSICTLDYRVISMRVNQIRGEQVIYEINFQILEDLKK